MTAEITLWEIIQGQTIGAVSVAVGFFVALVLNKIVDYWRDKKTYQSMLTVIQKEADSNKIILQESFLNFFDRGVVFRGFNLQAISDFIANPLFIVHAKKDNLALLQKYLRNLTLANLYREKSEKFAIENGMEDPWLQQIIPVWQKNLKMCKKDIEAVINMA